jgi:type II secretory pathway component PulF
VGIFLPVVVQMAAVGEETGTLPEMMLKVADGLDFEVDAGLTRFTSLLEPAMILVMGVVVGGMVLAVLLPIFQLSATIAR